MQTRYGYFRIPVPNAKRDGVICVRLDCPKKGEVLNYKAAMCFCSPKDSFSKQLAYKLLDCRFTTDDNRKHNIIELKYDGEKPPRSDLIMRDALRKALTMKRRTKNGSEKPFIPNWIMKQLNSLNDFHDERTPGLLGHTIADLPMGMTGGQ